MNIDDRFASRAEVINETPEPFRSALRQHLEPTESLRLLVFGPRFIAVGEHSPASLLAIGQRRWLLALEEEGGTTSVVQCPFEDTLFLELTSIILYGRLKCDFIAGGLPRSTAMEFNVVMDKLYKDAIDLILEGIAATPAPDVEPRDDPDADTHERVTATVLEGFPFKFRNMVPNSLPGGRRLLGAVHWPAIQGGFGRELAPASVLAATQRELILISEEAASRNWFRRAPAKFGGIAAYFPLARLARYHLIRQERFDVLDLEVHASHGGERLSIMFPTEQEVSVVRFMEQVVHRQDFPDT